MYVKNVDECENVYTSVPRLQRRTQEFFSTVRGSTNSVEDRENRDLGMVAL
jgi:hypothetical protein